MKAGMLEDRMTGGDLWGISQAAQDIQLMGYGSMFEALRKLSFIDTLDVGLAL